MPECFTVLLVSVHDELALLEDTISTQALMAPIEGTAKNPEAAMLVAKNCYDGDKIN
jgi:hypothetical protein